MKLAFYTLLLILACKLQVAHAQRYTPRAGSAAAMGSALGYGAATQTLIHEVRDPGTDGLAGSDVPGNTIAIDSKQVLQQMGLDANADWDSLSEDVQAAIVAVFVMIFGHEFTHFNMGSLFDIGTLAHAQALAQELEDLCCAACAFFGTPAGCYLNNFHKADMCQFHEGLLYYGLAEPEKNDSLCTCGELQLSPCFF